MVTRADYNAELVAAARCVLLEVMLLLGEYRSALVLVGGWAPVFLIAEPSSPHVGSTDVDLAVDHRHVTEAGYETIRGHLMRAGYEQDQQSPAVFRKQVGRVAVQLDLMSGEYEGTGKSRRHQEAEGTPLRKARGCDVAFIDPQQVTLTGELPGGGLDTVSIQVVSIGAFLCMKGHALNGRLKEKDAWDITFCLREFPGGIDAVAAQLRPIVHHGLVREALHSIREHFASPDHRGPRHVADFENIRDMTERARIQRDAFERVDALLKKLDMSP